MRDDLLWLTAYAGCVTSIIIVLLSGGTQPLRDATSWVEKGVQSASVFFVTSITAAELQSNYRGLQVADPLTGVPRPGPNTKVRVLIVPGHQPAIGGTEFGGIAERDVVVDIADTLAGFLSQNPHYEVMVARSKFAWHPTLGAYFDTHALDIETFMISQRAQMAAYLANGSITVDPNQVYHNTATPQGALQLYGINKWANDNNYDITLHLHLNDDAERRRNAAGKYSGFSVYIPDRHYSNAAASRAVGEAIAVRLSTYHATSTLPQESAGIVEDRELIAVGSNNSSDGASLLIEYGYIYEPQFQHSSVLPLAVSDYAFQTYLGLEDFFNDSVVATTGSLAFPYDWELVSAREGDRGPGIYALQAALHYLGHYPPKDKRFSDCPISGRVGPCTRAALAAYQRAHGLDTTGIFGPQTRAALSRDLSQ